MATPPCHGRLASIWRLVLRSSTGVVLCSTEWYWSLVLRSNTSEGGFKGASPWRGLKGAKRAWRGMLQGGFNGASRGLHLEGKLPRSFKNRGCLKGIRLEGGFTFSVVGHSATLRTFYKQIFSFTSTLSFLKLPPQLARLYLWETKPLPHWPMHATIPSCVGLNCPMCEVCTEAVHGVALWTRVTSQLWTCVKYAPKQSTA